MGRQGSENSTSLNRRYDVKPHNTGALKDKWPLQK